MFASIMEVVKSAEKYKKLRARVFTSPSFIIDSVKSANGRRLFPMALSSVVSS